MKKKCTQCHKDKDIQLFNKAKRGRYGVRGKCKACEQIYFHKYEKFQRKPIKESTKLKMRNSKKLYRKNNKEKMRKYRREYYRNNINYRISQAFRVRISNVMSKNQKCKSSLALLGCSWEDLRKYLESKFQKGMTWDNYGNPNGDHTNCWHIDHIIPCASFDLSKPEDQIKCFHYTNLQPLWGKDNLCKNTKILS